MWSQIASRLRIIVLSKLLSQCYWGQEDYLPKFDSRRIILGSCMCFAVYAREPLGKLILKCLTVITLPKLFAINSEMFSSPMVFVYIFRFPCLGRDKSGGVQVRFRIRFQAVKVPIFGGFPVENPTNKATASQLFQGKILCPSTVRRASEYG